MKIVNKYCLLCVKIIKKLLTLIVCEYIINNHIIIIT